MSTYKNIIGKPVKTLSSNLDNDQAEGQIWYNSTDQEFKNVMVGSAWSSASNLTNARRAGFGAGTQTAGLAAFGRAPSSSLATSEEYNGVGWATGGTANTARFSMAGSGTQTAAVGSGGYNPPGSPAFNFAATEEYDGSSWTSTGDLSTARSACAGFGIQTAAVNVSGYTNPGSVTGAAEHYNGSSWTSGGALNTVTQKTQQAVGTQTVGLAWGGDPPGPATGSKITEEYDGSSWTTGNNTNIDRSYGTRAGTQTDAVCGGTYGYATTTEAYDGTTWSTSPATMVSGRRDFGGADGSSSAAFACGGYDGSSFVTTTEELTKSINVITAGAWASSGVLSEGRATGGDCGISTAGLIFGGNPGDAPYSSAKTEEYNGATWSEGGDIPQATSDLSLAGTQTAALAFGWSSSPNNITASYDGSSWTAVPATIPSAPVSQGRGLGTQTAALMCGYDSTPGKTTDEYDGSSWTSGGVTNTKRDGQKPAGWGTQTAALLVSGYQTPPATITSNVESYNGSAWTETGHTVITAKKRTSGTTAAPNSNGFFSGGSDNAGANDKTTSVQLYNGTSWVTQPNMAIAKLNLFGFGTSTSAVVTGGDIATAYGVTTTEEFTGETSTVNVKTITTS